MTHNIEFTFEDPHNAQPFVIMLMQSGITDLTIKTSDEDYSSKVVYEIDDINISPEEAIEQDLEFIKEQGLTAITYRTF